MNEEFDLGIPAGPQDIPQPKPKAQGKKKDVSVAPEIDPEDDRANWPIIYVEFEEGKPNFEFMAVQGTKKDGTPFDHYLRVQRGVEVAVPPSIVHMLRDAISTHMKQVRNMQTGLNDRIFTDRSAVPWRLVKAGKYIA
jgi:hypothetical protein